LIGWLLIIFEMLSYGECFFPVVTAAQPQAGAWLHSRLRRQLLQMGQKSADIWLLSQKTFRQQRLSKDILNKCPFSLFCSAPGFG
jgi:hypothetical protein